MFKRFRAWWGRKKVAPVFSVLVVSDDAEANAFVCQTLSENGYKTYPARSAANALETLKTVKTPDLIIGDFAHPEVDGVEFLTRARAHIGKSTLPPVLFLVDGKEDEVAARTVGAQELMAKPVASATLLALVDKLLNTSQVTTAK
jgi:DNA-binding response OmpR family regulator